MEINTVIETIEKTAAQLAELAPQYRINIERKVNALKANPTMQAAIQVGEDLTVIARVAGVTA